MERIISHMDVKCLYLHEDIYIWTGSFINLWSCRVVRQLTPNVAIALLISCAYSGLRLEYVEPLDSLLTAMTIALSPEPHSLQDFVVWRLKQSLMAKKQFIKMSLRDIWTMIPSHSTPYFSNFSTKKTIINAKPRFSLLSRTEVRSLDPYGRASLRPKT